MRVLAYVPKSLGHHYYCHYYYHYHCYYHYYLPLRLTLTRTIGISYSKKRQDTTRAP